MAEPPATETLAVKRALREPGALEAALGYCRAIRLRLPAPTCFTDAPDRFIVDDLGRTHRCRLIAVAAPIPEGRDARARSGRG